jgi:hypothetical protein
LEKLARTVELVRTLRGMVIGLLPSKGYQEIDDRGNIIFIIPRIAIFSGISIVRANCLRNYEKEVKPLLSVLDLPNVATGHFCAAG